MSRWIPPAVLAALQEAEEHYLGIYAQIRPAQLKRAVAFYEAKALDALSR